MDENDRARMEQARGEQARLLLEHPLMAQAFSEVQRGMEEQMHAVNMHDRESRDELERSIRNLARVKAALRNYVVTGQYATSVLAMGKTRQWLDRLTKTV